MKLDMRVMWKFTVVLAFTVAMLAAASSCSSKSKKDTILFALVITTDSLSEANVGTPYSRNLKAVGGRTPYTWVLTGGAFPPGLSLSNDGLISGTPTTAGVFNFTVQVADAGSQTASKDFTIVVKETLAITTSSPLPNGVLDVAYSETLQASGGTTPYDWSQTAGTLPSGLSLAADGEVAGTPTETGNFSFTVQVMDADGETDSKDFSIMVEVLVITTDSPLPDGILDVAYSETLQASGGTTPYDWSQTAGMLPSGLSLATDGEVAGTPVETGSFSFTAQVTDAAANVATKDFSLTINDNSAITEEEWTDAFDNESKVASMEYVVIESGAASLERGGNGSGVEELDQFQETGSGSMSSSSYYGQTFTAGLTGKLTKISVRCESSGVVTLELFGATGTATANVGGMDWYDFVFDEPQPRVVAGTLYEFTLTPASGSIKVDWNGSSGSYPFGEVINPPGITVSGDLLFRTYVLQDGDFVSDTGTLTSIEIAPPSLTKWIEFSFIDSEPEAAATDVKYTVEAWNDNSSAWETPALIDASGAANGELDDSPVDLSSLDAATYTKLRLTATLTTTDVSNPEGPKIEEWKVTYQP